METASVTINGTPMQAMFSEMSNRKRLMERPEARSLEATTRLQVVKVADEPVAVVLTAEAASFLAQARKRGVECEVAGYTREQRGSSMFFVVDDIAPVGAAPSPRPRLTPKDREAQLRAIDAKLRRLR